mmetsp:Transcript_89158/g.251025  ORF Transcript_89158/g.251025 Transcript_89158/m.251025 type:complete len:298 (+) Transcript_89158:1594-2487(+)
MYGGDLGAAPPRSGRSDTPYCPFSSGPARSSLNICSTSVSSGLVADFNGVITSSKPFGLINLTSSTLLTASLTTDEASRAAALMALTSSCLVRKSGRGLPFSSAGRSTPFGPMPAADRAASSAALFMPSKIFCSASSTMKLLLTMSGNLTKRSWSHSSTVAKKSDHLDLRRVHESHRLVEEAQIDVRHCPVGGLGGGCRSPGQDHLHLLASNLAQPIGLRRGSAGPPRWLHADGAPGQWLGVERRIGHLEGLVVVDLPLRHDAVHALGVVVYVEDLLEVRVLREDAEVDADLEERRE